MHQSSTRRQRDDAARSDADARAARAAQVAVPDPLSPSERYGGLFIAVQSSRVFADSKTFVDCLPLRPPGQILDAWRTTRGREGFDLAHFVHENFREDAIATHRYACKPGQSLIAHIDGLWDVLTRRPREHVAGGTLLRLPNDYVVPGGRFGEIYYWDSYFTMLGLADSGRSDLLRDMADNFAYLIDHYGHVPNGNRSYYLSRSQPPVFALMVGLFERHGIAPALRYLPQLQREHEFWMAGADGLARDASCRHCVRLPDGSLLNRYWDACDTPREEAWREDMATAADCTRPDAEVWRDLRAAAASGWDFSARWFDDGSDRLSSTRTTSIVPVDLNAFLHRLEEQIATLAGADGDEDTARDYQARADARLGAVNRWLWDAAAGGYFDYDLVRDRRRDYASAAMATPLYMAMADDRQARGVAALLQRQLLQAGGLATSLVASGEQWDRPNGWAPLQWMAIQGLARYGIDAPAREIAHRWLATVGALYRREHKLVEKYDLRAAAGDAAGGGGGEYPLQDGFGWTNGVTRRLLHDYPNHPVHRLRVDRAPLPDG